MPRVSHRLVASKLKSGRYAIGVHHDGAGLYLQCTLAGDSSITRSWFFRFVLHGKERRMGLGSLVHVTLAEARELAGNAAKLVRQDIDPIAEKRTKRAALARQSISNITFDEAARTYIDKFSVGWKHKKHIAAWQSSLSKHASPLLGRQALKDINKALVLSVLKPIWSEYPETASRVRERVERILDWATAEGYRDGPNPAAWDGNLEFSLPAKANAVRHHPAMPYAQIPAFIQKLRNVDSITSRAIEFLILTASRSAEVTGAVLSEINTAERLWTIPASRMKGGKEHIIPLVPRALAIIEEITPVRRNQFLFPGRYGGGLADGTLLNTVRHLAPGATPHGFRSSFKDWATERTEIEHYVSESALAHSGGTSIEKAYRRTTVLEKRRLLMDMWSCFVEGQ
jgi:integrase